jgi:hypothetical protein
VSDAPAFRYPILARCIAEDRRPRPDELDHVARRIRREGSIGLPGPSMKVSAAMNAARTALTGHGGPSSRVLLPHPLTGKKV